MTNPHQRKAELITKTKLMPEFFDKVLHLFYLDKAMGCYVEIQGVPLDRFYRPPVGRYYALTYSQRKKRWKLLYRKKKGEKMHIKITMIEAEDFI